MIEDVICGYLLLIGTGLIPHSIAQTYSIVSTTVNHSGGWPSASDSRTGNPRWDWQWATSGGSTGQTSDAYYQADMSFSSGRGADIGPVSYLLSRQNITIRFRVRYTGTTPPPPISDIWVDHRFRLEATVTWVGDVSGTAYSSASSWWLNGNEPKQETALQENSPPYGSATTYFPGPGPDDWKKAGTVQALFAGWSNTFPGVWETTVTVPIPPQMVGDLTNTVRWVASGHSGNATAVQGDSFGRWEFRLIKFGPFTQPEF
jgi:hypothetical protein